MVNLHSVPAGTKPRVEGLDAPALHLAARCLRARAEARLAWAQQDEADLFQTRDCTLLAPPREAIDEFEITLECLAATSPGTIGGVEAMLKVAIDVLEARESDPEGHLGAGPALEVVRRAARALGHCRAAETPIPDLVSKRRAS